MNSLEKVEVTPANAGMEIDGCDTRKFVKLQKSLRSLRDHCPDLKTSDRVSETIAELEMRLKKLDLPTFPDNVAAASDSSNSSTGFVTSKRRSPAEACQIVEEAADDVRKLADSLGVEWKCAHYPPILKLGSRYIFITPLGSFVGTLKSIQEGVDYLFDFVSIISDWKDPHSQCTALALGDFFIRAGDLIAGYEIVHSQSDPK